MDVKIIVRGGVCDVEENNVDAKVIIIDWDEDIEEGVNIEENLDSVIVEGSGGVFEIIHCPENIKSELIDYDNLYNGFVNN